MFDDPTEISCPTCETPNPIEILYGLPSPEMVDAEAMGTISLGGSATQGDDPAYQCRQCGERFGTV